MLLKRIYHQDKLERNEQGSVTKVHNGAVRGVKILRCSNDVHHFSPSFIEGGVMEGWLSMGEGRLTITPVEGEPVIYNIIRVPGYYCCHCEEAIIDANQVVGREGKVVKTLGMKHVEGKHANTPSPDPNNPSGYRKENYYTGVLVSAVVENEEGKALEKEVRQAVFERIGEKHRTAVQRAKERREEKQQLTSSKDNGRE